VEKLLKILACPVCKGDVKFDDNKIVCCACSRHYDVNGEVPVMLDEESRTEIDSYLASCAGQHMVDEYFEKGLFWKLYMAARRITGGSDLHQPVKERLDEIIGAGGEDGLVIEVGSGHRRLHEKVVNVDISLFNNVDIIADGAKLPFKDGTVDAVLIIAVLEHARQPRELIEECRRVMKKGGVIYAEAPFVFRYHSYPTDFWRFSQNGMEEIFHGFTKKDTGVCVGPSSGLLTFLTHYVTLFSFSDSPVINGILKGMVFALLFPLKYLDLLLVKNKRAHELAAGIYYTGEKQ